MFKWGKHLSFCLGYYHSWIRFGLLVICQLPLESHKVTMQKRTPSSTQWFSSPLICNIWFGITETTNTNHLVATASHNRLSSGVRQHGPFKFNVPKLWSPVEALTELKTLRTGGPCLTFPVHLHHPCGCARPVHHFLPSPDPTHF